MTFEELKPLLDQLMPSDFQSVRDYLKQRESQALLQAGTMNVDTLLEAVDDIRNSMSEVDLEEMIATMNEDYIEAVDDSLWEN
jgi:hypothetical protein